MNDLHVLSGGAAQGLVLALQEAFRAETGANMHGTFGAVGTMRARLLAGERCDVIILTAAIIDALESEGRVLAGTQATLGRVRTGVAVRAGAVSPVIDDGATLRAALIAATGIYFPDPELATAGIHFVKVLGQLGIKDEVGPRLKPFPNGAAAMQELARSTEPTPLGCTQITEIKYTPGVALVGPLPAEFELATVYTGAVCAGARSGDLARDFLRMLCGPAAQTLREDSGFE